MKLNLFKAKRGVTNLDTDDEKKFDEYLKQLKITDRKKYLKEYIKALESKISSSKRKLSKRKKQLKEI